MSSLASIDPHAAAAANPDHAHDLDGRLVYDPRCWWCRQVTAQAPATGTASAGGGSP